VGVKRNSLNLFIILVVLVSLVNPFNVVGNGNYVVLIKVSGGIYYGTSDLVAEGIREAERLDAPLLILIDTPGGLLSVIEDIAKLIRNSNVPVIGYVYPRGASAWSAGTLLLMATHIAAMSPGSLMGAAQPVYYDPATGSYKPINESKILNPIVGIITSLAKDRGRNVTAAEKFVRENLYLDEEKAYEYHVIEVIADDVDDLLNKIDGWYVKLDTGRTYVLKTSGAKVIEYSGSLRIFVTELISEPLINSIIATMGVLLLIIGVLSTHYHVVPLAVGLIILSLIGGGFSTNMVSILLLIVGATALAIEMLTPGFGVLGFTGIVLIAISIALMPVLNPGYLISPVYQATLFWIGVSMGVGLGGFTSFLLYKIVKIKRQPPKLKTDIVGSIGRALENIPEGGVGFIMIDGEYWRAVGLENIVEGDKVIVVDKDGVLLKIKKYRG